MMFFNLAKILLMNLEVVIIFREQISKLYFGGESIKTVGAIPYSSGDRSMKISYDFQEKDKELNS